MKIAVGSTIAILIASWMGLQYSASAGIITLLSITDTKRETIGLAIHRFLAFVISTALAFLLFEVLGFKTYVFGVYILCFMSISCLLRLSNAVSICAVLTTHFLAEQSMSRQIILNEFGLFFIGAGIGVLFNLYMPDNTKMIHVHMKEIELEIRQILIEFSNRLSQKVTNSQRQASIELNHRIDTTKSKIEQAMKLAYNNSKNNLISDTRYYLQYLDMRKNQLLKLGQIKDLLQHLTYLPIQAEELARFMLMIQDSFHEYNNALDLMEHARTIRKEYQGQEIPQTIQEFENRAILYQILQDLEEFLLIKHEFIKRLTPEQIQSFWRNI